MAEVVVQGLKGVLVGAAVVALGALTAVLWRTPPWLRRMPLVSARLAISSGALCLCAVVLFIFGLFNQPGWDRVSWAAGGGIGCGLAFAFWRQRLRRDRRPPEA